MKKKTRKNKVLKGSYKIQIDELNVPGRIYMKLNSEQIKKLKNGK